mmetsp:Transcript_105004/g.336092  ORF Transcript_105004/g.336092 Transcript_105004/m.336092 type:complete len:239 (+) Transcript_105004:428-1144(+)
MQPVAVAAQQQPDYQRRCHVLASQRRSTPARRTTHTIRGSAARAAAQRPPRWGTLRSGQNEDRDRRWAHGCRGRRRVRGFRPAYPGRDSASAPAAPRGRLRRCGALQRGRARRRWVPWMQPQSGGRWPAVPRRRRSGCAGGAAARTLRPRAPGASEAVSVAPPAEGGASANQLLLRPASHCSGPRGMPLSAPQPWHLHTRPSARGRRRRGKRPIGPGVSGQPGVMLEELEDPRRTTKT